MVTHPDIQQTGWRRVLLRALSAGAVATGIAGVLGWALTDGDAGLSALAGGAAVLVLAGLTLALVDAAERWAPQLSVTAFFLGFLLKVAAFVVVVSLPGRPAWVDPLWMGCAAIGVLVVWQIAQVRAFTRMRLGVAPRG